ncbi:MAG: hypothetical protein R6V14_08115 [Halanaerobiales bacterium]
MPCIFKVKGGSLNFAVSGSVNEFNRALEVIKEIIEGKLKLKLNSDKTVVTNFGEGFTFLGYEFKYSQYKSPR